jgi:CzcA family heavy metal efflux pump
MRAILEWSLRFRLIVVAVAAGILAIGISQLRTAPLDILPEFTPPYVEIQTEALGLSADEVEQLITVPLEADLLHGVAFLDEIRSESVAGLSSIVLIFNPGTDIFRARQVVAERLTQAHALPNVSKPPAMLQPLSSASRVLMVSLASKDLSLIEMSVLARWTIRPRLMSVSGVANVSIFGQRERQLQVLVDPQRLRDQRVQLQHVIENTGNALWVSPLTFLDASTPGAGGFIDTPNQRLGVQHIFPIRTPEDLAQVPIAPEDTGGRIVRLGDVARVVEDHQPLIGDAVVNDGSGLLLVIEKFPNANTPEVTRHVEQALDALRPGLGGVQLDATVFRPATFIEEAIRNVSLALLAGLILVAAVLFLFFRNWRAALIALVTIPLSLTVSLFALFLFGATINAILVAGLVLAIGVVVDDAIVGVNEILRRARHPHEFDPGKPATAIVLEAAIERRSALLYATLIVLLATVPLFFLSGEAGSFQPHILAAYIVAMVASMVVAVTVTPALAVLVLSGTPRAHQQSALSRRLHNGYALLLSRMLQRTRPAFAGAAVVTVAVIALAGVATLPHLGESFVPTFKERDLLIRWEGALGTSNQEMNRITARAGAELRSIPGVRNVGGHVGRAVNSDQVVNVNSAELWVSIDPAADYDATLAAVQRAVDGYPGLQRAVGTYTTDRVDEVLATPERDVVVRVYGQQDAVLRAKAHEVGAALSGVAGLVDVAVELPRDEPTLKVKVDLAAAETYGLKPGDIRRTTAALLSGIQVGSMFEDQKVFEVVVWGIPELRQSLSSIQNLPLQTPTGVEIRLRDVADVSIAPSPAAINREGVFRYVDVSATLSGRDLGSVLADTQTRLGEIQFPIEYRAEILGAAAERQASLVRLLVLAAAAAIGILLLLQSAFSSWRRAALVFVALPTALVGAAIGAILTGGVLSIGVIAGLIATLTIAARTAVVMVDRYQHLESTPGGSVGTELILDGARERFAPVLATTVATALAMLPFIVLGGLPGLEIMRPMAIVIVAGLPTLMLFTLFLVPAVYFRSGPSPQPDEATQRIDQPGLSPA